METKAVKIRHEDDRAVAVVAEHAGVETEYPLHRGHLLDADVAAAAWRWTPRRPPTCWPRPRTCATATSSPSPWWCPRRGSSRTTGSTSTPPRSSSAASRTSARGRPTWSRKAAPASGMEYFVFEGDDTWSMSDEDLVELAKTELGKIGLVSPSDVEAGYVVRVPKAYPFYDERYKANVHAHARLARRLRPERAPGRPQRHAPVQQPGPLDVHRDAHRREHRRRRRLRRVGGERRGGVPRGAGPRRPRGRAPAATPRSSPATRFGPDHPVNRPGS